MDEEGRDYSDGEEENGSLGAYSNMESSDIRPDFYGGRASEEDEIEGGGARGNAADRAKDALKRGENAAAKKIAEKGLNAATGGVAGTALKVADKAGIDTTNLAGAALKGAKAGFKFKKALPLLVIVVAVVALWSVGSFVGQWLFPFGFKARMSEEWNSTKTSTAARTDAMMNEQMECEVDEDFPESVYSNMHFSAEQKEAFESAGLGYKQDGCSTVLTFTGADGVEKIVTSDKTISKYMNNGQQIADGGDLVGDSGAEGVSEEEAKEQILAKMEIAADADQVMTFSEALNDSKFKQLYMTATKWWRGDTSGWFTDMTETVMERLGISRNNYSDFQLTGNDETDKEAFLEIAKAKPAAEEGSKIGDKSLKERVTEVAKNSAEPNCGTSSAFTDIEGVISADQTARQVSAGSLWLEAIDKTKAGEGNGAPLSVANNIIVESGGASTEGVSHLFGSGVLDQANEMVQKVSAQAHGNDSSIVDNTNQAEYRECIYTGNVSNDDGVKGAIVPIGSIFNRTSQWLSSAVDSLKNIFGIITGTGDGTLVGDGPSETSIYADNALSSTADEYEEMKNQSYFNGDDTALIGEAMVTASERIYNEKAKSAGQVVGDETALLATYRAQQDLIAEEAEYDRATKSPFDITSKNTFLGNIAYSLIPFATSSSATALTSTVSNVGSLVSSSLSSLLPTSQAISEAQVARGDCVLSNNIGAVSNPHCNNYYNSDLSLASSTPKSLLKQVANLRYDEKGYTYRSHYNDCDADGTSCTLRSVSRDDPNYGEGPLNEQEGNSCVSEYAKSFNGQDILSQPIAWSYSRYTNFEYEGYASGWPNRNSSGSAGAEEAKNDVNPEQCVLDVKMDNSGQPVVNKNGALGVFLLASGQRGSEWGVADQSNIDIISKSDFTKGRIHPCLVGSAECNDAKYVDLGWSSFIGSTDENGIMILNKLGEYLSKIKGTDGTDADTLKKATMSSEFMSRWIGGSAFVYYSGNEGAFGSMNTGFSNDNRFKDETRGGDYFWNEMKYYQAYSELLEWMESAGVVGTSAATVAVSDYYKDNPLDNSYEGIIARYSGLSKERVAAVIDLLEYVAFLKDYDATALYPLPAVEPEELRYDNNEIVAAAEQIIQNSSIVYADLRTRTQIA